MEKFMQIIEHPLFQMSIQKIRKLECGRIYCCHGIEHGLDVARLAYIRTLEEQLPLTKDLVYGAALLHDIGRWQQYESDIPHDVAGAELSDKILRDTDFDENEREQILDAILYHRHFAMGEGKMLAELLYDADKQSRICCFCQAYDSCYWQEERKNKEIRY